MRTDRRNRVDGFLDQAVSSGSNFVTGFLLARQLGASGFGTFALVYSFWVVFLSVTRSFLIQPFVVEASDLVGSAFRTVTRRAAQAVLLVGVAGGVGALSVSLLGLDFQLRLALLALAVSLPLLALQDLVRFAAFAAGRADKALWNDLAFAGVQGVALLALLVFGIMTPATALVAWGLGALAGCALGYRQFGLGRESLTETWSWVRRAGSTGKWFTLSSVVYTVGLNGSLLFVSVRFGREALGGLRAVGNVMAPTQVFLAAMESVGLPSAVAARNHGRTRERMSAWRVSRLVFVVTSVYGVVLMLAGPSVVTTVFGDSFRRYESLLVPTIATAVLSAAGIGPILGLRAAGRGLALVRVQVVASIARLLGGVATLIVLAPLGLAWAFCVAAVVQTILYWSEFLRGPGRDKQTPAAVY